MKGYISFFQRKSTAPEQELTELWLVWWTGVINKNYLPSGIISGSVIWAHTLHLLSWWDKCHAQGHATGLHTSDPTRQMQHVGVGGGGRKGGHYGGCFLSPKPKCGREVGAQQTIKGAIAIRTQISLAQEGMARKESKLREAVTVFSPASSHFQHKSFPRQMWFLCS